MTVNNSTSVVRQEPERCPLARGPRWRIVGKERDARPAGRILRIPKTEEDTVDLVRGVRCGRDDGWGRLMERYGDRIEKYAERRLGRDLRRIFEPQDIANEAWMRVVRSIDIWKPSGPRGFYRWLCLQVRRVVLDKRREFERRDRAPGMVSPFDPSSDSEPADSSSGPVSKSSRRDELRQVTRALRSLPKTYREPLVAVLVEGGARPDVAARLGISENNLSQRLHRGLELLRERILRLEGLSSLRSSVAAG